MASEFSDRRLYLGNLPKNATKKDVEDLFAKHGHGKIVETKLMNGFGFVEYEDAADARDIVPTYHGTDFMGERLTVQFARGTKRREDFANNQGNADRSFPRPRRTPYKMNISGMAADTSWQDLKDFARRSNVDVVYSEVSRERDGRGMVEFETGDDLKAAIRQLDGTEFKGQTVKCTPDNNVVDDSRGRGRSASPRPRRMERSPPRPGYRSPPPPGRSYRERSPVPRNGREYAAPYERSPRGRDPYYRERERESYRSAQGAYDEHGYPPKREYDDYRANPRPYGDRRLERSPPPPTRSPRRYAEEDYRRRY